MTLSTHSKIPFNILFKNPHSLAEGSVSHVPLNPPVVIEPFAIVQVNFMVELDWLMMCYAAGRVDTKPLVILYGAETPELASPTLPTNIRAIRQEQRNQSINRSLRIR